MSGEQVVIAGAGHAGGSVAAFLRQYGHQGPITLVGDETIAPYQRPPLSKAWLKGEADAESLLLRPLDWYVEAGVDLRLGTGIEAIDRVGCSVRLSDGTSVAYDRLVLALGAKARRMDVPGSDLCHVGVLRSAADAEWLKPRLGPGERVAIIGGGYVGLEAAASARSLGAEVVVLERESRLLARVAAPMLSAFYLERHQAEGVVFVFGAEVRSIEGNGVRLATGEMIAADTVLVGIGALPNDALAREVGIACSDGVIVDSAARTSDPNIFAIGDMTYRPLPLFGRSLRLESVPSALEQAKQAAATICGTLPPAPEIPWFWSDQYDLKLQIAGLPLDCDQMVVRGDPRSGSFALFHLADRVVRAVEAVNAPGEFMAGRQFIARGTSIDTYRLADSTIPMKQVAATT